MFPLALVFLTVYIFSALVVRRVTEGAGKSLKTGRRRRRIELEIQIVWS
jgi:hypothetical protein